MKLLRCSFFVLAFSSLFFSFFYHITTYKSRLVFLFNVSSYHPFSDRTRRWRRQKRGKQSTAIHHTPSSQSGLWVIARNLRVYLIIRSQIRNTLTDGDDVEIPLNDVFFNHRTKPRYEHPLSIIFQRIFSNSRTKLLTYFEISFVKVLYISFGKVCLQFIESLDRAILSSRFLSLYQIFWSNISNKHQYQQCWFYRIYWSTKKNAWLNSFYRRYMTSEESGYTLLSV